MSLRIRPAGPDDHVDIMRIFDGALLETDPDRIRSQLTDGSGCLLVAETDGRLVGAVGVIHAAETGDVPPAYRETAYLSAIAVRRSRRGQGVGHALIEAAAEQAAPRPLSATFDERVRPFYTACGFEIDRRKGRLWGVRTADTAD